MRPYPIYPIINITEYSVGSPNTITVHHFIAETFLRVKHDDGKWYLTKLSAEKHIPDSIHMENEKRAEIQRIHNAAYIHIVCGKISLDCICSNGNPSFILDVDQRSEEERLQALNSMIIAKKK